MKILFLGQVGEGQTSRMRMSALRRLGHEVVGVETSALWREAGWAQRQLQRRLGGGAIAARVNASVIAAAQAFRPDLVWGEKQEYLTVETLERLRAGGARLVHFTPDPYFYLDWKRTPLMDAAISRFDALIYCKAYERADYEALGKPLIYMPLGYCDEVHRPLPSDDPRWACAVGFLGGWEPRREQLLRAVASAVDDLKIWGGYWDFLRDGRWSLRRQIILGQLAGGEPFRIARDERLGRAWQGGEVYADDYARALTGGRIGVGFLRKVCPDQHTTRTFEIPACGSLLLADRTEEHQSFFEEGREAEFFGTEDELVDKARFYAGNEAARARIAAAGRARCETSGYSYLERLRPVMGEIEAMPAGKSAGVSGPRPVRLKSVRQASGPERLLVAYARRFPMRRGKFRAVNALWPLVAGGDPMRMAEIKYGGLRLACDLRQVLQRQNYFFGTYFLEEHLLETWRSFARQAQVVFDVGANAGIYSLAALDAHPAAHAHAFEPTPEIAGRLRETAALNGLGNLFVHEQAVSNFDGQAVLTRCGEDEGFNEGMNFIVRDRAQPGAERVAAVRLDTICAELGIARIDLLKLDVQGAEADALEGAADLLARGAIGTVFMELNFAPPHAPSCPATGALRRLEGAGFEFAAPGAELRWAPAGDWLRRCSDVICRLKRAT